MGRATIDRSSPSCVSILQTCKGNSSASTQISLVFSEYHSLAYHHPSHSKTLREPCPASYAIQLKILVPLASIPVRTEPLITCSRETPQAFLFPCYKYVARIVTGGVSISSAKTGGNRAEPQFSFTNVPSFRRFPVYLPAPGNASQEFR